LSYKYSIYGIVVSTSIPFKQLKHSNTIHHEDVVVSLDTSLDVPFECLKYAHWYHANTSEIIYVRKDVACFFIRNGKEIRFKSYPGADHQEIVRVLLGIPMGFLLQQRGLHALHASVVRIGHQSAAFLGVSGSGKSTIAASFLNHNHALLTEDVAVLNLSDMMVSPAFPWLKIGQDSLNEMALPERPLVGLTTDSRERLGYQLDETQFCGQSTKLKNCYLLEWGDQLKIEPVEAKQAFFDLFPHTFRPITDTGSEELDIESFKKMTDFSNKVSVYKLTRPKSFASLDDCRVLVEEHMQQT
jgi:hypothetical protein